MYVPFLLVITLTTTNTKTSRLKLVIFTNLSHTANLETVHVTRYLASSVYNFLTVIYIFYFIKADSELINYVIKMSLNIIINK